VSQVGPIVSLTSYGERVGAVHLAIESIARGSLLPSRLILWLDDEAVFLNPPAAVNRLKQRGLEVRLTKNYGPHTKYYPYLEITETFEHPLVTADDDVLYPRFWLLRLVQAFQEHPKVINCYRARVIALRGQGLAKYKDWLICESTQPSFRHFATGVAGVIYPPQILAALKKAGSAFQQCCPKADDIWLHAQALRAGYKVRQIAPHALHLQILPGTQRTALESYNCFASGNDRQAMQTYNVNDVQVIRSNGPPALGQLVHSRRQAVSGAKVMPEIPLVTAVIPTHNRPALVKRAAHSALNQTYPRIEVVVVVDGPDGCTCRELATISDARLRVVELPRHMGGSDARNLGMDSARGEWIALLDDDDEWLPQKTEVQMSLARRSSFRYPIVCSRLFLRTSQCELIWPRDQPYSPVCEYLLVRNHWSYGGGLVSTITLLFPRDLYKLVPFKSGLPRHQDLDWVLRATQQEGAGIEFAPEPLAVWHKAEQRKSVSSSANWRGSYEWIGSVRDMITPRAYGSFIASDIAWQAAAQHAWRALFPLLWEACYKGNLKPADVIRYAGFWLVPPSVRSAFKSLVAGVC
jgi:glycosyltransferase involved in cell wall biosynthesis